MLVVGAVDSGGALRHAFSLIRDSDASHVATNSSHGDHDLCSPFDLLGDHPALLQASRG